MRAILIISAIAVIAFSSLTGFQPNSEPIELRYADSLIGSNVPGMSYREFFGNVELVQGDINVKSDYAKQFIDANMAKLIGNVIITRNTVKLTAPRVDYFGNNYRAVCDSGVVIEDGPTLIFADKGIYDTRDKEADFRGNVVIDDDSATIFASEVFHSRISRNSAASGDVIIIGKFTSVILTGDTVFNSPDDNYSYASGNPVLYQVDTLTETRDTLMKDENDIPQFTTYEREFLDTLTIRSDTMTAFREDGNERYYFIGRVEIFRGNISARSGSAVYYKDKEYITMKDSPVVWYDSTQLFADSVIVHLPNKRLNKIQAFSNSFAVSRDTSLPPERLNQISGNEIIIEIAEDKIRYVKSFGEAKSLYYFVDEKGPSGADRKTTDSIIVTFDAGEPDNVLWLGKSYAEYFPELMIFDKPKEYYLPGFRYEADKPEKIDMELEIPEYEILTGRKK